MVTRRGGRKQCSPGATLRHFTVEDLPKRIKPVPVKLSPPVVTRRGGRKPLPLGAVLRCSTADALSPCSVPEYMVNPVYFATSPTVNSPREIITYVVNSPEEIITPFVYTPTDTAAPAGFHTGIDALCHQMLPSKYAPDPENPGAIIYDEEDEDTYAYQILLYDGVALAEDPEYRNKPPTLFDPIAFYTEQAARERKDDPNALLSSRFYKVKSTNCLPSTCSISKDDIMDNNVRRNVREDVLVALYHDATHMPRFTRLEYLNRFYDGVEPYSISEATVNDIYRGGDDKVDLLFVKGEYVEALDMIRHTNEVSLKEAFTTYLRQQPPMSHPINLLELDQIQYSPRNKAGEVSILVQQPYQRMLGYLRKLKDMTSVLPNISQTTRLTLITDITSRMGALSKLMATGDLVVSDEIIHMLCGGTVDVHDNGKLTGLLNMSHGHTCGIMVGDEVAVALPAKHKNGNIDALEINRGIDLGSNRLISKTCLFKSTDIFDHHRLDDKVLLAVATPFSVGAVGYHTRLKTVLSEMLQVSADEYDHIAAARKTEASINDICTELEVALQDIDQPWYTLKMYHIPHLEGSTSTREVTIDHSTVTLTITHQKFEVDHMAAKAKPSTIQYKFIAQRSGRTAKTDILYTIVDDEVIRVTRSNDSAAATHRPGLYRITPTIELEFALPWPDDEDLEANMVFLTLDGATAVLKATKRSRTEYGKLQETFNDMQSQVEVMRKQLDDMKVQLKDKSHDHDHKTEELKLKQAAHDLNKYVVETEVMDKRFNQHLALMKLSQSSRDILFKVISKAETRGGNLVASSISQIAGMTTGSNIMVQSLTGPIETYMAALDKSEQIEFFTQLHSVENENIRQLASWLDRRYTELSSIHMEPEPVKEVQPPVTPKVAKVEDPAPEIKAASGWSGKAAKMAKSVIAGLAVLSLGMYLGFGMVVVGGAALTAAALTYI